MTKTRVLAALIMAPVAIAAILLLPTQWLAAAAAAVLLIGLWEWLKLAGIEDTLARTVLLVLNLLLMVLRCGPMAAHWCCSRSLHWPVSPGGWPHWSGCASSTSARSRRRLRGS